MKAEKILKTKGPLPENKKLVINLMLSANGASSKIGEAVKPFDISIQQFNVLRILRGQKGRPANLSTVQERMVNQMSNTTRLIDKLLEKQLVERFTCEENRRKIEIFITQKGLDLLKEIDPVINKTEEDIASSLSEKEVLQLNELLEKLLD